MYTTRSTQTNDSAPESKPEDCTLAEKTQEHASLVEAKEPEKVKEAEKVNKSLPFVRGNPSSFFYRVLAREPIANQKPIECNKNQEPRSLEDVPRASILRRFRSQTSNDYYNVNQMKKQQQEARRQEEKQLQEKCENYLKFYMEELKREEEIREKSKRRLLKQMRDDILDKDAQRGILAKTVRIENSKTNVQLQPDEEVLQRTNQTTQQHKHQLRVDVIADEAFTVFIQW